MADMTRVFVPRPDKFKRLSYDKSQLKQFNVFKTISMDLNNKKNLHILILIFPQLTIFFHLGE